MKPPGGNTWQINRLDVKVRARKNTLKVTVLTWLTPAYTNAQLCLRARLAENLYIYIPSEHSSLFVLGGKPFLLFGTLSLSWWRHHSVGLLYHSASWNMTQTNKPGPWYSHKKAHLGFSSGHLTKAPLFKSIMYGVDILPIHQTS